MKSVKYKLAEIQLNLHHLVYARIFCRGNMVFMHHPQNVIV